MILPKSIRVLGRKFSVTSVDNIAGLPGAMGITYPFDQRIEIAEMQHVQSAHLMTTLIHEATHAAVHVSGLSVMMNDLQEESLVTMLTHFIEELIPQLAKIKEQQ